MAGPPGQESKNMTAGKRRLKRVLKLVDRLPAYKPPLQLQGADVAAFLYVQVHVTFSLRQEFSLHCKEGLLGSNYSRNHIESSPVKQSVFGAAF